MRTLEKVRGGWRFAETRRARSRRIIKLQEWVLETLKSLQSRTIQRNGHSWPAGAELVFTTPAGCPIHSDKLARFQSSLVETVVWCKLQPLWAEADSEDIRQRHAAYLRAEQLFHEAHRSAKASGAGRKVTETEPWQDAMALFKQIRDSLGPMNRELRSLELKPSLNVLDFRTDPLWAEAVAEVVAKRSRLTAGKSVGKTNSNAVSGQLLLYNPHENLACGAAEYSSSGFFDTNNVPPWDIWVDFSQGTLVSWVPPVLIDLAQMGVESNPEECIRWAT